MNTNRIIKTIAAAALVAGILSSCSSRDSRYDAEGFFESEEITISAEETGKILRLDVREGEVLSKGQVIAEIDSTQLYLSRIQLQKNVKSVLSNKPDVSLQIAALKSQLATAKAEKQRFERLLADGASTTKALDDINAQISVLEAQLQAQQSSLKNTTESLDAQSSSIDIQIAQLDNRLSKCRIIAPTNGTVLEKYLNEGEFAAAGRPVVKIADLENVYLRAYLTSSQISQVKLGQKVKVYADFGGDNVREYEGTIEWIASKSEFTPKNIQTADERENLVYAVKVAVKNDGFVKLGMYGGLCY